MTSYRWLLIAALLTVLPSLTFAAGHDQWMEYYTFRHSSTLPGMLFGVTPQGQIDFSGALQQNIPVAHTPSWGNYVIGGNSGSNSASLPTKLSGGSVNGTGFAGVGLGQPGHGVYLSWMDTGTDMAEAWNLQVQVVPGSEERVALAVGVIDALNEREKYWDEHHNARSVYATATGRFRPADRRPVYWTLGLGSGRFDSVVFGGVSVPADDHLRLVAEWDGFGANLGAAYALNGAGNHRDWDAIGYLGWTNLQHPMVGLTFTWR